MADLAVLACGLMEGYGVNGQIMKFSLSVTKPEITELSKRAGIPLPRELQLQFENQETVLLVSELQLSNMTQFQLAKAILSALGGLGTALSYGEQPPPKVD